MFNGVEQVFPCRTGVLPRLLDGLFTTLAPRGTFSPEALKGGVLLGRAISDSSDRSAQTPAQSGIKLSIIVNNGHFDLFLTYARQVPTAVGMPVKSAISHTQAVYMRVHRAAVCTMRLIVPLRLTYKQARTGPFEPGMPSLSTLNGMVGARYLPCS